MAYIWKVSDCIMRLRLMLIAFILSFFSIFLFLSLFCMSAKKISVIVLSGTSEARILSVGVYIRTMSCNV